MLLEVEEKNQMKNDFSLLFVCRNREKFQYIQHTEYNMWHNNHEIVHTNSGDEMHIEYFVKELRQKAGYTTEELHIRAGVSVGYINGIEKGDIKEPSLYKIARIAKALNLQLQDLYKITW